MIHRRQFLAAAAMGAAGIAFPARVPAPAHASDPPADFAAIQERAAALARRPYAPPPQAPKQAVDLVGPQAFNRIRYRPESALWGGEDGYEVRFLKPGRHAPTLVEIHEIADARVRPIAYSPAQFDVDGLDLEGGVLDAGGYGGFKVLYPLHPENGWKDELLVFRGASYFRMLGRDQWYGLSARGLAIDTALPGREEFPVFREFWLKRPAGPEAPLEILALLDGPSVCGAYAFEFLPGDWTRCTVTADLHARRSIEKIGLAPLTSMFLRAESGARTGQREVHDSDGLQLLTGAGEYIWRPLAKRRGVNINTFSDTSPRGFGLMQRDRNAANYPSPEKRYHMRPGYWVEPLEDWGRGHVELIEIGTTDEDFDNVVCFWTPEQQVRAGDRRKLRYRITSMDGPIGWAGGGRTVRSMVRPGGKTSSTMTHLEATVEFGGHRLEELTTDAEIIAVLNSPQAEIANTRIGLRDGIAQLSFEALSDRRGAIELRAYLTRGPNALTETWSYLWTA